MNTSCSHFPATYPLSHGEIPSLHGITTTFRTIKLSMISLQTLVLLCLQLLHSTQGSFLLNTVESQKCFLSCSSLRRRQNKLVVNLLRRPAAGKKAATALAVTNQETAQLADQPTTLRKKSFTLDLLRGLSTASSGTKARQILRDALLVDNDNDETGSALYGSIRIPAGASKRGISDGDLAIQTRMINKKYNIIELIELNGDRDADRASLALLCVMMGCSLSAIVANQSLNFIPEILRFLIVWLLSFAPLAFVGYGIADASELQGLLVTVQRNVFPAYRQRMLQHEAGHFLMGHLLGWPVRKYSANAVKNAVELYPLADTDRGSSLARQLGFDKRSSRGGDSDSLDQTPPWDDVPFFSEDGRGSSTLGLSVFRTAKNYTEFVKLPSQNEPTNAWPYRPLDDATLDQLTAISVAGVCAEILAFGNAEGGVADLSQLRQLFSAADSELSDREIDNRIRYALGYTMSQLRRHLGVLDALAAVMERDGSVEECVLAIETCENVSGQGIIGDYELNRRKSFREAQASWIERIFLGDEKTADTAEDRMVEGKGGGYKKETFRLTGDDPLYAAMAVALGFLAWASSGGLSLH